MSSKLCATNHLLGCCGGAGVVTTCCWLMPRQYSCTARSTRQHRAAASAWRCQGTGGDPSTPPAPRVRGRAAAGVGRSGLQAVVMAHPALCGCSWLPPSALGAPDQLHDDVTPFVTRAASCCAPWHPTWQQQPSPGGPYVCDDCSTNESELATSIYALGTAANLPPYSNSIYTSTVAACRHGSCQGVCGVPGGLAG
jgi:hypothetical protein